MAFDIAAYIDHTILKPATTQADITKLCKEASSHSFAAVCIPPYYIPTAKKLLLNTNIKTATVIGFPFGYNSIVSKVSDIHEALRAGADELDIVINLAALKNGDWSYLESEMMACIQPIKASGKVIKVIVESGILTDQELVQCCDIYSRLQVDFMKTSTGYAEVGATVHAVQLMRKHLPESISIKASGGIRTFAFANELIEAGATRLGCSASVQIVNESKTVV